MPKTKLLTITEAASAVGVSYSCFTKWVAAGRVKAVYTGAKKQRARFVTQAEVNRILKGGVR